jgi:hypothetical protein
VGSVAFQPSGGDRRHLLPAAELVRVRHRRRRRRKSRLLARLMLLAGMVVVPGLAWAVMP